MSFAARLIAAAALVALAIPALAHGYKIGTLEIGHPWTRATPPGATVAGAFMTIGNSGNEPDRLVGGSSPAGRVEIHTMEMTNGIMKMREMPDGLPLPAGETVELKPGGFHIMIVGLSAPFEEGRRVPLTLEFEKAGKVDVELAVSAPGAPGTKDEHQHQHQGGVSGGSDETAIADLMKSMFDKPDAPLTVEPVVVVGDNAVAGWAQGDTGGRALLKRGHHGWRIVLCSGDALKETASLVEIGLPDHDATAISARLAEAEAALDPALVARFSLFDGIVMMDEEGGHPTGHGESGHGHDHGEAAQ